MAQPYVLAAMAQMRSMMTKPASELMNTLVDDPGTLEAARIAFGYDKGEEVVDDWRGIIKGLLGSLGDRPVGVGSAELMAFLASSLVSDAHIEELT